MLTEKRKDQVRKAMDAIEGLGPAEWDGDAFAEADWPSPSAVARVWVEANDAVVGDMKPYSFGVGVWYHRPAMNEEARPEKPLPEPWHEEQFEEGLAQAIDELRKLLPS